MATFTYVNTTETTTGGGRRTFTGTAQYATVDTAWTYDIVAYGGQGGNSTGSKGGYGAEEGGDFALSAQEKLKIVVAGAGAARYNGGEVVALHLCWAAPTAARPISSWLRPAAEAVATAVALAAPAQHKGDRLRQRPGRRRRP